MKVMKKILHKSDSRGVADHGWLKSRFSFSFANYFNHDRMQFGALRVLNDDKIAAGKGFGMHPHKNMEIISIPLTGKLLHRDDLGTDVIIGPGEVQVMSAGRGVTHSEMNPSSVIDGEFLQIWIQTRMNDIDPSHAHASFSATEQKERFATLVRPDTAKGLGLPIAQDAYISRGIFSEKQKTKYEIKRGGNGAYIFILAGAVAIDAEMLGSRDALGVWDTSQVEIAVLAPSDILVIEVPMSESA